MIELSHVALASSSISTVAEKLRILGLQVETTHGVPTEKVQAAMIPVGLAPEFRIELLEPTAADSPISRFLEKKPEGGVHHLCFKVHDLPRWEKVLGEAGLRVLPPGIRVAARGRALFIHPKDMGGVLVELEELNP